MFLLDNLCFGFETKPFNLMSDQINTKDRINDDVMINLERTQQVTDAIHDTIRLSGLEAAIISTPIFNRLHRVLQSSMVYLTYSSNRVKRFEHSVGTMYIAGEILYKSILNTSDSEALNQLISEAEAKLKDWYETADCIHGPFLDSEIQDKFSSRNITEAPVPNCALYKEYRPGGIADEHWFIYAVLLESIRLAGLLHDIGHLPYSHVFEYAVSTLYGRVKAKEEENCNKVEQQFLELLSPYFDGNVELHEELGMNLLHQIEAEIAKEFPYRDSTDNLFVAAVINFTKEILGAKLSSNDLFSDLHRIISGVVDADRLDYCSRDLVSTGLRKDVFAYQRLLSTYKLILKRFDYDEAGERKHVLFCPAEKTLHDVEELLERRWTIFSRINYHHRVHKYEVLFAEVLALIGESELTHLGEEGNQNLPIIENGSPLPLKVHSIWAVIQSLSRNKNLLDYYIIQLDDSWMDTVLKTGFFEKYQNNYRSMNANWDDPEWHMFDELISTRKHYRSLYKRGVDFNKFDKLFRDAWLKEYNYVVEEGVATDDSDVLHKLTSSIKGIDDGVNSTSLMAKAGFAVNLSVETVFPDKALKTAFYQKIEMRVNQYLADQGKDALNIRHCFIRPCAFSLGCFSNGAPVYFHGQKGRISLFDQISETDDHLRTLMNRFLPFHLYYLPVYDCSSNTWRDSMLEDFEVCICNTLFDEFQKEMARLPKSIPSRLPTPPEASA